MLMAARNRLYDHQWLRTHRSKAYVISIGNLTTGGTGKTPLVIALARRLSSQGHKVGILSRGYGRKTTGYALVPVGSRAETQTLEPGSLSEKYGDEPVEMAGALTNIPVAVCENRVLGAATMVRDLGVEVILLDDGFQHRRLHRDLDIVVVDTTQPLWAERVLPFGLSRESWSGMSRASLVVLTKTNLGDADFWRRRVQLHAPKAEVLQTRIKVLELRPVSSKQAASLPLGDIKGASVALMSALGNPAAFEKTVTEFCGARVHSHLRLKDHARLDEAMVLEFAEGLKNSGVGCLLITQKDAVKVQIPASLKLPVYSVEIECELVGDWSGVDAAISRRR